MRVIGIIPARMASTRFPGKPLALIAGRPMVQHVYEAVARSKTVFPYYIAAESPEMFRACADLGMEFIVTRYECRNGTERVHDAMRNLSKRTGDIVINVQADEPTIRPESLDALALVFNDPAVQIASLCFKLSNPAFVYNINRVKVMLEETGDALFFARRITSPGAWRSFRQHVGVYAYRREVLSRLCELSPNGDLEQVAWMRAGYKIRMLEIPYETVAVDIPADIALAEAAVVAHRTS